MSHKKSKDTEPDVSGVLFRWLPDEETLLATCYVAVFEDNNVRKAQAKDTFCVENEVDIMKRARTIYREENKNTQFSEEDAWEILRHHLKWDAPVPVDLTEDEHILAVNTDELFGPDARPRPPELRLKREAAEAAFEVAKEKDRMMMRLEEMNFFAINTADVGGCGGVNGVTLTRALTGVFWYVDVMVLKLM
nr:hypothetical protein [Tanacetum cinerariifolium]